MRLLLIRLVGPFWPFAFSTSVPSLIKSHLFAGLANRWSCAPPSDTWLLPAQRFVYLAARRLWKEGLPGRENDRGNVSWYGRVVAGGCDELLKAFQMRKSACHEGGSVKTDEG